MDELHATPCCTVRSEHGEGPMWDPRHDELLWVDIPAGHVHRAALADGGLHRVATYSIGRPVSAVVPTAGGGDGWVLATELGFAWLDGDGTMATIAEPEGPAAGERRMNDGTCDPWGRFWAGSMAYDETPGAGALYVLDRDLHVHTVLQGVTISNGMAWADAGQVAYYIDTPTQRVDRLTLDGTTVVRRERAFDVDPALGAPDGMAIDAEGCLWIALWGGGAVVRCSPTGELLARVEVGPSRASAVAFGGPDLSTLFITTARPDPDGPPDPDERDAGLVHAVHVGVPGLPAERFGPVARRRPQTTAGGGRGIPAGAALRPSG